MSNYENQALDSSALGDQRQGEFGAAGEDRFERSASNDVAAARQGYGEELPAGASHDAGSRPHHGHGHAGPGSGHQDRSGGDVSGGLGSGGYERSGVGETDPSRRDDLTSGTGAGYEGGGMHGDVGQEAGRTKPTFGEKVKGTYEGLKGKVTKDPQLQTEGELRKEGELGSAKQL